MKNTAKRITALLLALLLAAPLLASCGNGGEEAVTEVEGNPDSEADDKQNEISVSEGNDTRINCDIGVIEYYKENGNNGDLNLLITEYNNQPGHAFMQVKEYDNAEDLNSAMLSGEVDMVITPNWLILKDYIEQELLVSLEEAVPALFEKDVLIESVVDAVKVAGVCYYLPVDFDVCGEFIADPSFLKDGKLFEDRLAYYDYIKENDPEHFKFYTPSDILDAFANDLDEWIDWESKTCHFDDGTFSALLELCTLGSPQGLIGEYQLTKSLLEVYWEHYTKAGSFTLRDAVESYRFTDVKKAQEYQKGLLVPADGVYGPTMWVQVDFPMPSRVHEGYAIDAHNLYAIVDHEDTKAACGDFLRWLILEDVEEEFQENDKRPYYVLRRGWDRFSINKDETDRYLRRLWDRYLDPEVEAANVHPDVLSQHPEAAEMARYNARDYNAKCGESRYEVTWDYIEKADHLRYYESEISAVIRIEAHKVFSGFCTAEKAAENIQNRISLYLAKQS